MIFYFVNALLVADLLSGIVHWAEDRYGNPDWPFIGTHVIKPNIEHHTDQMAFTIGGYWERNWTSVVPAALLAGAAYACGMTFVALVFALLSQANEVHAWAHQKCMRPIRGLQLLGILHSPDQHAQHHRRPFDANYCTMTDVLNPLLSSCAFWRGLEGLVQFCTGWIPRPERQLA